MTTQERVEILVVGAGLAGIATSYYLCTKHKQASVLLVDCRPPMSYTSAQSGDNYRNWWPHPTMTAFTNTSIELMEQIARDSRNVLHMTRRGYLLATRESNIDSLIDSLYAGYEKSPADSIRVHTTPNPCSYAEAVTAAWGSAPRGVDVLSNQALIRQSFPSLSHEVNNALHVRRAGDINGQQLGQYMLERIKETNGSRLSAEVLSIKSGHEFVVEVEAVNGRRHITADVIVNAAGPFAKTVAAMIDVDLPIDNIYHQKIAFNDQQSVIPRQLPFSCDLDDICFDWNADDRALLAEDAETAWLTQKLPGGAHCRPEGGDRSTWVKLGWAYNKSPSAAQADLANEPLRNPQFPEIAMRAAARLNPSLRAYVDNFPSQFVHYGGYYSMTCENWPLIGPLSVEGAYVVGALSGFGSMSACAAGALCAAWITGDELPDYAAQLSMARYADRELMADLENAQSLGIL